MSIFLIIIGMLQITGYVIKSPLLRGLGFSYGASPLPTVFGTVKGVEGFATRHTIHFINKYGAADSLALDKKVFNNLKVSYLLKNAYSIFLAYPHMLKAGQVENGINFLLKEETLQTQFLLLPPVKDSKLESRRLINGRVEIKYYTPSSR